MVSLTELSSHRQQEASEGIISKGRYVRASLFQGCDHENRRVSPWNFSEVEITGASQKGPSCSLLGTITLASSPFPEETSSQDHRPPSSTQKPAPSVSDLSGAPRPDLLFILWLQAPDWG